MDTTPLDYERAEAGTATSRSPVCSLIFVAPLSERRSSTGVGPASL